MKKAFLSKKINETRMQAISIHFRKGMGLRFLFLSLFAVTGIVVQAQVPTISGLSLDASSENDLTIDELTASFTTGTGVTETATAWVKFGDPEALLQMPCEVDSLTALIDFSGNGNDAYHGALDSRVPHWDPVAGYNGSGAFVFDGDDFLNAGNIFPLSSSYTKMAWVNMGGSSYRNILSSMEYDHRNHFFKVDDNGRLNAGHSEGTPIVEDTEVLTPGEWHFVAVTFEYTTGEMILYKNGVAIDTEIVVDTLRDVEYSSVLIGAMLYSWEWIGAIDEPRIYDHALSPEQINSFYVNGFNVIVPEETQGYDLWRAMVTPFSSTQVGTTTGSNNLRVNSMLPTQIPDQTVSEGSAFPTIDLDDYIIDYEFPDDELTWTYTGNTELTVAINPADNVLTVTIPDGDWFGSEVITFTVSNPRTEAHDIIVTFTVESANDAPVITVIGDQSTDEDTDLNGLVVTFTDADVSDAHTITVESDEANVTVAALSGNTSGSTYNLVPAADWNGTAQITVTVTDDGDGALSDVEIYTLTVDPVDDAPSIVEVGDLDVDEDDVLLGVAVNFTDPDVGDTHSITVASDEANVVVANLSGDVSGSTYDLIPAADWNGTAQITVTVSQNGSAVEDTEVYTLTVNSINDVPDTIELSNNTIDERVVLGTVVGLFSTEDVDAGDEHVYSFVSDGGVFDVDNGAFVIVGDTLKTNAEIDYEVQNSYSILVQSDDEQGGIKVLNFIINVNDVDETAVEDFYNHPAFSVYPVPAVDYVTVEIDNPENRELLLEIYYATGAVVHSETIFDKKKVDLSGFKDGMYIVRISGEQVYGTRKLIVKDR